MTTPRHEFYETDEKVIISIFDRGADPAQVKVAFQPRELAYTHGEKSLTLEPLKGQIDTEKSTYFVGKVKVEVSLVKRAQGRWGGLIGDAPDPLANTSYNAPPTTSTARPRQKNWEGISDEILKSEKERSTEEDPNVGGDSTLNSFFQKIYADADEDTRRAMMKSFSESGGTTLSTNWDDVRKKPVEVKPPSGSEYKKWN
ncbi:SGS-domain-containing protein [Macrolepiota fuliginosa MF-IS2]|uniref:SGS-domain-containing protein n=1 Tax=Macrolepiota fuliginosa MF-IS2 TaxID=1400762 RepID=A0A9P5XR70_9AGAR|nr:SGS-domain-containing protein [Macrolepiota fuliginosa MF-IS2]